MVRPCLEKSTWMLLLSFAIPVWLLYGVVFLGCLFLRCLCMSNPLNGHFIVCPWIWKLACPDPTCNTAFVVLRNGFPRRRGTSSLQPMSRMTKSVGMYVSRILTKISWANPSGCREVWFAISSLNFVVDKGPPKILSYITLDMTLMLAPRSQKALWKTAYWACDRRAAMIFFLSDEWWIYKIIMVFLT